MSAGDYSRRIESLLRKIKGASYQKSDEIRLNPYGEIVSALEYRVPQERFDWFKLCYQAIDGQRLQELLDEKFDVEKLIKDLQQVIENTSL